MKKKNIWLIRAKFEQAYLAGTKFENDISEICKNKKFKEILYSTPNNSSYKRIIAYIKTLFLLIFSIKNNEIVFVDLPVRSFYAKIFQMILKIKKCKVYGIIIDLDSLRNVGKIGIVEEVKKFMYMKGIIVQNQAQKAIISSSGYTGRIEIMGILDFLGTPRFEKSKYKDNYSVCYGGNLSDVQSAFLYKWEENVKHIQINIFGVNFQKKFDNKNFYYCGNFPPDEIIYHLCGNFGLVWNGTELETCGGDRGNYYRYASPHKLSMYVMAGMPVIVWSESAMASFVKNNGIGFTINSLLEIEKRLLNLSEYEYNFYLNNVFKLQKKLSVGFYLNRCIENILGEKE